MKNHAETGTEQPSSTGILRQRHGIPDSKPRKHVPIFCAIYAERIQPVNGSLR
jgi:hypothetical protein